VRRFDGDRFATAAQIAATRVIYRYSHSNTPHDRDRVHQGPRQRQHRLATYGALR